MKKNNKIEYIVFGIISFLLVLLICVYTGTLFSGYHLVDDHEVYTIMQQLEMKGLIRTIIDTVGNDFNLRFRPLYFFLRVIETWSLGDNLVLWSMVNVIEIALSALFLYTFARKMKTNIVFSAFFALFAVVGEQAVVWWRLGPQECLGILLVSIVLLSIYYLNENPTRGTRIWFVLSMILLSLQKESFCISMPGFFFILLGLYLNEHTEDSLAKRIKAFLRQYAVEITILITIFVLEIITIVFFIGTNSIGYAGISSDMTILDYLDGIKVSLTRSRLPYFFMVLAMFLFLQVAIKKGSIRLQEICELLFCAYIFSSQLILHAKSVMNKRYLIPWTICICYFLFILGYRWMKDNKRLALVAAEIYIVFLFVFLAKVIPLAELFTLQGKDINACAAYVSENTNTDCSIACVSEDSEMDYSFGVLMGIKYGYSNCKEILKCNGDLNSIVNADILFCKNNQIEEFITQTANKTIDDYEIFKTPSYEIAVRKK